MILVLAGAWDSVHMDAADRVLTRATRRSKAGRGAAEQLVIDLAAVTRFDTAGAWLVERARAQVPDQGGNVTYPRKSLPTMFPSVDAKKKKQFFRAHRWNRMAAEIGLPPVVQ